MMAGPGADFHAGGGPARHIPVLLDEVMAALSPGAGQTFVDGTFGAGGYTRALLGADAEVIAIDRDPNAIAGGAALVEASDGRLRLVHGAFAELDMLAGEELDGVVLDIGVSSMQLDEAERGFSFRADGPLDMRMSGRGLSAADVVNTFKAGDIARTTRDRVQKSIDSERAAAEDSLASKMADAEKHIANVKASALGEVDEIASETAQTLIGMLGGGKATKAELTKALSEVRG